MLHFACPSCRTPLLPVKGGEQQARDCNECGRRYVLQAGIWRFLPKARLEHFEQFLREYETVRTREGRRADPQTCVRLPYGVDEGPFREQWRIRAQSYRALHSRVLRPMLRAGSGPLSVLDLGAGHCWLSHRLADLGFHAAAVDLSTSDWDGLGAHRYYPTHFIPIQAEFDRLPFLDATFHLAIFNGSFHYSESYEEALRVLRPKGQLVIMDSPIYRKEESGKRMIAEREAQFRRDLGFASNAIASEGYLTHERISKLGDALQISFELERPGYGLRWEWRRLKARARGREAAQFMLIVGTRKA